MSESSIRLGDIATTRSGDKGSHANLAIVARGEPEYAHLVQHLTSELIAEYFAATGVRLVERYELPQLGALNFLLHDALAGGASRSLRWDTQGKLLGTQALEIRLPSLQPE